MRAVNLPGETYPDTLSNNCLCSPPETGTTYLIFCHEKISVIFGCSASAVADSKSACDRDFSSAMVPRLVCKAFSSSVSVDGPDSCAMDGLVPRLKMVTEVWPAVPVLNSVKIKRSDANKIP